MNSWGAVTYRNSLFEPLAGRAPSRAAREYARPTDRDPFPLEERLNSVLSGWSEPASRVAGWSRESGTGSAGTPRPTIGPRVGSAGTPRPTIGPKVG
jgi:hypothetical protein